MTLKCAAPRKWGAGDYTELVKQSPVLLGQKLSRTETGLFEIT